jgi:hypothetical protein
MMSDDMPTTTIDLFSAGAPASAESHSALASGVGIPMPPKPPPIPPSLSVVALSRIPGVADSGESVRIVVRGKEYSLSDIVAATRATREEARIAALQALGSLHGLGNTELYFAISTLFAIGHEAGSCGEEGRVQLRELLERHFPQPEAVHLAIQVVKKCSHDARFETCLHLVSQVSTVLTGSSAHTISSRREFIEARYVALRALETEAFKAVAFVRLRALLENQSETFKLERKDLANNLLAILRAMPVQATDVVDLRRLCSFVFATGFAPTSTRHRTEQQIAETAGTFTTANQAETQRQYGLATALETRKAIPLRGRPMTLEEYSSALRFGPNTSLQLPSNQQWPTKTEWNALHTLLLSTLNDPSFSLTDKVALLSLLATHVKVEDRNDPRESRFRPDILPTESREQVLSEVEALKLTSEDMLLVDESIKKFESSLLSADFSKWRYSPAIRRKEHRSLMPSEARFTVEENSSVARLVALLSLPDAVRIALRLSPEDLHVIRQTRSLTLDEFRAVSHSLRIRAVSCEWALGAILDLVRAPQGEGVTAEVRTAVLGSVVAEARKVGKLTQKLEKEIFAVSAEIPGLPFLQTDIEERSSSDPEDHE